MMLGFRTYQLSVMAESVRCDHKLDIRYVMHVQGKRESLRTQLSWQPNRGQLSGSGQEGDGWSPFGALPLRDSVQICFCKFVEPGSNPSLSARTIKAPIRGLLWFWRRERDSNPRRASNPYSLSRGALSTAQPSLLLTAAGGWGSRIIT